MTKQSLHVVDSMWIAQVKHQMNQIQFATKLYLDQLHLLSIALSKRYHAHQCFLGISISMFLGQVIKFHVMFSFNLAHLINSIIVKNFVPIHKILFYQ